MIKDTFTACGIVEGFDGEEHTAEEHLQAWAYLIKSGNAWNLQGWYGRNASQFIDNGYITKQGDITELGYELARG